MDPLITLRVARPFRDQARGSNVRGTLAFAMSPEPNTRNTQIYINLGDNTRNDAEPFAVFGRVVEGMDAYLDRNFPLLDRLIRADLIVSRTGTSAASSDLPRSAL